MSNSIWKMPDVKPDIDKQIIIKNDFDYIIYFGKCAVAPGNKWAYIDDLIAQADKAERLAEENEAMRDEFEVWHGNYMCVVEDKERLEQAVQYLKRLHVATIEKYNPKEKELAEQTIDYAIEMAIEQQSNN